MNKPDDGGPDFEEVLVSNGDGSTHNAVRVSESFWRKLYAGLALEPCTRHLIQQEGELDDYGDFAHTVAYRTSIVADAMSRASRREGGDD